MILFINSSPKMKNSSSAKYINLVKNNLSSSVVDYVYNHDMQKIVKDIEKSNTIVISYPLYFDTIPCKLIDLITYIKDNKIDISGKKVYVIVNCGFLDPKNNDISIEILRKFFTNNNCLFKGYLSIGSGEVIANSRFDKIYNIVSKKFYKDLKKFILKVEDEEEIGLSCRIHPMNNRLYCHICNHYFRKAIKNNK